MTDGKRMPVLFAGHGSPMNAIENNVFTRGWRDIAAKLPRPRAILAISAHWVTEGVHTSNSAQPRTVYDMYGFPRPLYEVKYPAPGSPELAERLLQLLPGAAIDNTWGIDHGTWSVLVHMFPGADIPVVQLGLSERLDAAAHLKLGRALAPLRDEGVLIFGSGNVVHNLRLVDWDNEGGEPWADEFDAYIKQRVEARDFEAVADHRRAGASAAKAFPTPEHFWPLLYALGASDEADRLTVFNDARTLGSLSMTSYLFG
jgi:4,5-DOPA dioxygenase extradiol